MKLKSPPLTVQSAMNLSKAESAALILGHSPGKP
jgi:hypothetical protein